MSGCRTLWFVRVRIFPRMRNKLRRYYGQGDLHFLTFSCCQRRPLLGGVPSRSTCLLQASSGSRSVTARNLFVQILGEVRQRHGFL